MNRQTKGVRTKKNNKKKYLSIGSIARGSKWVNFMKKGGKTSCETRGFHNFYNYNIENWVWLGLELVAAGAFCCCSLLSSQEFDLLG